MVQCQSYHALTIHHIGIQQPCKEDILDEGFRETRHSGVERDVEHFQLEEVSKDGFKIIDLRRKYKPKELYEEMKSKITVPIGCSFYEYKGELENIPEEKRILFMNEVQLN